jgi:hypothetical protein
LLGKKGNVGSEEVGEIGREEEGPLLSVRHGLNEYRLCIY